MSNDVSGSKNDDDDIDDSSNWSTVEYWGGVAESVVRITAAGFAGSLIGLAKERLYDTQQQTPKETSLTSKVYVYKPSDAATPANISQQNSLLFSKKIPRRPPQMPIQATTSAATSAMSNLPIVWSISCMLFTIVLESCRLSSPTSAILKLLEDSKMQSLQSSSTEYDIARTRINFQNQVQRTAVTSFGDYALGGTIAGLAGAIGQRRQQRKIAKASMANRLPTARFGLATGLGLGIIAGTFQAAIDVGNLYLKEEEQRRRNSEMRQEQDENDRQVTDEVGEEPSN